MKEIPSRCPMCGSEKNWLCVRKPEKEKPQSSRCKRKEKSGGEGTAVDLDDGGAVLPYAAGAVMAVVAVWRLIRRFRGVRYRCGECGYSNGYRYD